jgi:putative NADPH-quinone reductase/1,4-dihydroxy-2-naphthoate octaprenyltransferase
MHKRLRVLLIQGHPRPGSFCDAVAEAYAAGAGEAGVDLRRLDLRALSFSPHVTQPSPLDQAIEPDLQEAVAVLAWAQHMVFVFPTWWGAMPALLKGFLDRALMPGFAFAHRADGHGWEKLLQGRTAELLTTMDTPPLVYRWIYGAPGVRALARATLGFCGIRTVRTRLFGPILNSTPADRAAWLAQAGTLGRRLQNGVLGPWQRFGDGMLSWLAALRLQFHPMAWAAYALGSRIGAGTWHGMAMSRFWGGLLAVFSLEVATVLTNEWFDLPSDHRNKNHSVFSGESRVLVDGRIRPVALRAGIGFALLIYLVTAAWLAWQRAALWPLLIIAPVLGLGYTAPPLCFSWRGAGELDVAVTHSLLLLLFGHVLQGGAWDDPKPWLLGLPIAFSVFAAITLSGLPDAEADRAVGKRTLAVLAGADSAVRAAWLATVLTVAGAALAWSFALPVGWPLAFCVSALAHGLYQLKRLSMLRALPQTAGRIDSDMSTALGFILWFVTIPLLSLSS